MKKLSIQILMLIILGMTVTFTACNSGSKTEKVDKTGKEYTSAYICPMHCPGSGADEPGNCSVCGMPMVKNENHEMHQKPAEEMPAEVPTEESHEEESHEGHDH
ncbi:MAG: heavy metal-binding domain-containing protein [Chitinophagales bacterium]